MLESMIVLPWVLLGLVALIQGAGLWMTQVRLNEVALVAARAEASGSAVPSARLRAAALKLKPTQLVLETDLYDEGVEVIARYPIEPRWLARLAVSFGQPPWLSAQQRAQAVPSVRQQPLQ